MREQAHGNCLVLVNVLFAFGDGSLARWWAWSRSGIKLISGIDHRHSCRGMSQHVTRDWHNFKNSPLERLLALVIVTSHTYRSQIK